MSCYHCGSTALYRDTDEHGLPEVTCVICGREQLRVPVDPTSLHAAEYIEMTFERHATRAARKEVAEGWHS